MLIKVLHITLAFNLLASSVGLVINQHFCRDELKRTSLFTAVASCHEPKDSETAGCPLHQQHSGESGWDKKDCCQNSSHYLKSCQEQQLEQQVLPVWSSLVPALTFRHTSTALSMLSSVLVRPFYRPPPLMTDRTLRFQVFRL